MFKPSKEVMMFIIVIGISMAIALLAVRALWLDNEKQLKAMVNPPQATPKIVEVPLERYEIITGCFEGATMIKIEREGWIYKLNAFGSLIPCFQGTKK